MSAAGPVRDRREGDVAKSFEPGAPVAAEGLLAQLDPDLATLVLCEYPKGYKSRSEACWYVLASLVESGWDDAKICELLLQHPLGNRYLERKNPRKTLLEDINRARTKTGQQLPLKPKEDVEPESSELRLEGSALASIPANWYEGYAHRWLTEEYSECGKIALHLQKDRKTKIVNGLPCNYLQCPDCGPKYRSDVVDHFARQITPQTNLYLHVVLTNRTDSLTDSLTRKIRERAPSTCGTATGDRSDGWVRIDLPAGRTAVLSTVRHQMRGKKPPLRLTAERALMVCAASIYRVGDKNAIRFSHSWAKSRACTGWVRIAAHGDEILAEVKREFEAHGARMDYGLEGPVWIWPEQMTEAQITATVQSIVAAERANYQELRRVEEAELRAADT